MEYQEYRRHLEDELIRLEGQFKNERESGVISLNALHKYVSEHLMIEVTHSNKFMYEPSIDEFKAEITFDGQWRERQQLAQIIARESAYGLGFDKELSYEKLLAMGMLINYDMFKELYKNNIVEEASNIWYFLALKFGVCSVMTEGYFKHRHKFAFDVDTPKIWCGQTNYKGVTLYTTDNDIERRHERIEKHNKLIGLE